MLEWNKTPNQVLKFLLYEQAKEIQNLKNQFEKARLFLANQEYCLCSKCSEWTSDDEITLCISCYKEYCDGCINIIHCCICVYHYCHNCSNVETFVECIKFSKIYCRDHWNQRGGCTCC